MDEEEMMMWSNDFVEKGERDEMFTERGGGGCFIATAAFETPFAEEINVLRIWRDDWLLKNRLGVIFVCFYYKISPPIANRIRISDTKRSWTRKLLTPFIKILSEKYK
ncbi:MAG: hypothetical protein QF895_03380 [SAR86 cluster bacterium]|nr:hypothetical protein [SAR86 cluster bacterium]